VLVVVVVLLLLVIVVVLVIVVMLLVETHAQAHVASPVVAGLEQGGEVEVGRGVVEGGLHVEHVERRSSPTSSRVVVRVGHGRTADGQMRGHTPVRMGRRGTPSGVAVGGVQTMRQGRGLVVLMAQLLERLLLLLLLMMPVRRRRRGGRRRGHGVSSLAWCNVRRVVGVQGEVMTRLVHRSTLVLS
jgi:hypothetical protein